MRSAIINESWPVPLAGATNVRIIELQRAGIRRTGGSAERSIPRFMLSRADKKISLSLWRHPFDVVVHLFPFLSSLSLALKTLGALAHENVR